MKEPLSQQQQDTAERDDIAWKNQQELSRLASVYGLYIPASQLRYWRPTVLSSGDIPGVWTNITIIATDGILAWYLIPEKVGPTGVSLAQGHIQFFTGNVKTLYSQDPPPKAPKTRKTLFNKAWELLQQLQNI